TAFIPGTMGKAGKLPSHNCKTKGQLVMFFTVDKAGNVTNAGRSSGIKDACNITAAVIWMKQYVKAKKSQNISQGTYTINF
ncbi:MAG: ferric siderophore ABC transporter substrate-binding protein, partial [Chryseobacterium sp.]|nr:ferric siderophore ABC transporter substrate-binding protein [Chryseobacterium sp.]